MYNHASFVEKLAEPGEREIFSMTLGEHFDSVFIQVSLETYITPKFQDWLKDFVIPRLTPACDSVRIAITNNRVN